MLLLLVLGLCSKCLSVELQTSSSSTMTPAVESNTTESVKPTAATNTSFATTISSCDVNNTSCATMSKNNVTATTVAKISSATPLASSAVSTTATPATAAPNIDLEMLKNFDPDLCTCNLQRQFCDINCCCDEDCSLEDKMVFRSCRREPNLIRDTSFCQYMDYIYINNTPYAWEVNQNGLFCIAKSNLPLRYTLQKKKPIDTLEDAELQKENKYSWLDVDEQVAESKFNMTESFLYGASIWMIKRNVIDLFELPNSFITHVCLLKENMKFLQNFKSKCSQILSENNPSLSAAIYFEDTFIIRAPRFFNESFFKGNFKDCPKNVCLPIEANICEENSQQCYNFSLTDSRMSGSCNFSVAANKNVCTNVVEKVKYKFHHNGTEGFTRVELFVTLKNVSYYAHKENSEFAQQFEVGYFWSNHSLNYSSLLSGNPGYLIGKPVLAANLVTYVNTTNSTVSNKTESLMHSHAERNAFDVTDNFLVFPASKRGVCVLNNDTYVASEFGYNMILKCRIKATFDLKDKNFTASDCCQVLQKKIFTYWPISNTNLTGVNKLIGSFGNANASESADWMQILSNQTPEQILNATSGNLTRENTTLLCNNLITTLKIDIFHSRVDFKDLCNQKKIVGASFHFGMPKSLKFPYDKSKLAFEADIREELMFFDVTSERVQKFVDPPSFKISLPYDFFYPFIKVGNTADVLHFYPLVMIASCIFSIC